MAFVEPLNLAEAKERQEALILKLDDIKTELSSLNVNNFQKKFNTKKAYFKWRSAKTKAAAITGSEIGYLKEWIAQKNLAFQAIIQGNVVLDQSADPLLLLTKLNAMIKKRIVWAERDQELRKFVQYVSQYLRQHQDELTILARPLSEDESIRQRFGIPGDQAITEIDRQNYRDICSAEIAIEFNLSPPPALY